MFEGSKQQQQKILLWLLLWKVTAYDTVARTWGHREHNFNAANQTVTRSGPQTVTDLPRTSHMYSKRIKMLLNLLFLFIVDIKPYDVKQNKPNNFIPVSPQSLHNTCTAYNLLSSPWCVVLHNNPTGSAVPSTTVSQTLPQTVVLEHNNTNILSKSHKPNSDSTKRDTERPFWTTLCLWR